MNPSRRAGLRISQHVCQAVRGLQCSQKMYVIGYSSDLLGDASQVSENSSKIGMQFCTP